MAAIVRSIRLSLQEYFARPGRDPRRWGQPFAALLGAFTAQQQLDIAAIGGKDSMSGSFKDLDVPPTLVAFAVAIVDVRRVVSPEFKKAGSRVLLLPLPRDEREMPDFTVLKKNYARVHELIKKGKILAAQSLHGGGLAEAISKMSFGNRIGMVFNDFMTPAELFSPAIGSLVLEVAEHEDVEKLFSGLAYRVLGRTRSAALIRVNGLEFDLASLQKSWEKPLEDIFPTRVEKSPLAPDPGYERPYSRERAKRQVRRSIARPRVLITTFPGTNNEYDVARAFDKAGGVPEIFVFRNQCADDIEASIVELDKRIRRSQMLMIPGGFSAGDEPDGSGKFIAAVFRNPRLRDAVGDLMNKKDGLILGICNGFQALIKLGLLPHGEIRDLTPDSPTLTFNLIGRLVSRPVHTKVVSTLSPWFNLCHAGDIHTIPVAHAEGRFVAPAGHDRAPLFPRPGGHAVRRFRGPSGRRLLFQSQRLHAGHRGHFQPRRPHPGQNGPQRPHRQICFAEHPRRQGPEDVRVGGEVFPVGRGHSPF